MAPPKPPLALLARPEQENFTPPGRVLPHQFSQADGELGLGVCQVAGSQVFLEGALRKSVDLFAAADQQAGAIFQMGQQRIGIQGAEQRLERDQHFSLTDVGRTFVAIPRAPDVREPHTPALPTPPAPALRRRQEPA